MRRSPLSYLAIAMKSMSEITSGLVHRFNMVHFYLNYHSNLSEKIKTNMEGKVSKFVVQFTTCLVHQLSHETELYIGAGTVLPRSIKIFSRLSLSTLILDYKRHLHDIYVRYYTLVVNLNDDLLSLNEFNSTFSNVLHSFEDYIQCVQKTVVNMFHQRQNEFVREKMKIVPTVLNLCKVQTPEALISILSQGTKSVPHYQICDYNYFLVVDQELRNVINRCFHKIVGYWPLSNSISSIHQYFIEILSQSPCNHLFVNFMHTLISEYHDYYALCKSSMDMESRMEKNPKTSMVPDGYSRCLTKGWGQYSFLFLGSLRNMNSKPYLEAMFQYYPVRAAC